jgi:hypothetical protein
MWELEVRLRFHVRIVSKATVPQVALSPSNRKEDLGEFKASFFGKKDKNTVLGKSQRRTLSFDDCDWSKNCMSGGVI